MNFIAGSVTELIARWLTKNLLVVDILFDNKPISDDEDPQAAPETNSSTLEHSQEAAHVRGSLVAFKLLIELLNCLWFNFIFFFFFSELFTNLSLCLPNSTVISLLISWMNRFPSDSPSKFDFCQFELRLNRICFFYR